MTNEQLTQKIVEHEGILHELKDKVGSANHRLDEQAEEIRDLRNLTLAVQRVGDKVEEVADKVDGIDARTQKLESEPVENYKHYKRTIVSCVITTIVGAIVGAVLALVLITK